MSHAVPTPVNEKLVELIKLQTTGGVHGVEGTTKYSGEELAASVGVVVPIDYTSWGLVAALVAVVAHQLLPTGVFRI